MAFWSRVASFITGGAVASAAAEGVRPVLEPVRQHAWTKNQLRVLDPGTVARMVAQAIVSESEATDEASRTGFNENRLRALVHLAQVAPALSDARRLRRRGRLTVDDLHHVYAKEQIQPQYWDELDALIAELLDPGQIAAAIHRGIIPDPGLLLGQQPEPPFNVEAYPVYPIDALKEAEGHGLDRDRLGVLVGLQGLPMGVIEAAQAFFRKIITHGDYIRAFNESNNRNEWADAVLEYARQIPTARDFFENALRGYHDLAWAQEQARRHGMSDADSLVIYQNQGRPMALTNITKALARGGKFQPEPGELTDPYMASIVEGNLKPGYYDLARHLVYQYPSAFVFRTLAQEGVLGGQPEVRQWLLELGWPPELADKTATAWAPTTAGASSAVRTEQGRVRTTTHRSYVAQETDEATARATLARTGLDAADIDAIMPLWDAERALVRAQLSASDIRKAVQQLDVNAATGVAWTRDDGLAALMDRGWSMTDAQSYLDIPYKG